MTWLYILLAASIGLCLVMTRILRTGAYLVGLVDRPDKRRKIHDRAIPVAGGIAIFLTGSLVLMAAFFYPGEFQELAAPQAHNLLLLLVGCAIICAVGVLDDAYSLAGRPKLLGQLMAVGVVMSSGFVVRNLEFFGWTVELGLLAIPFTAFWILGGINSFNLLDGMDGLLGIVGVIITACIAVVAMEGGQWVAASVAIVLSGALLGFLAYNFPPATIFLGDGGSMLVGLLASVLTVQATTGPVPTTWSPAYALALLSLPMCDTLAAIVRRKLTGRSVFCSDRGHLHHCLLRRGFLPKGALCVIAGLTFLSTLGAIASLVFASDWIAILTTPVLGLLLIESKLFGYAESLLLRRQIRAFAVRLVLGRMKGRVQNLEVRLQGSMAWEQLWERLVQCAGELNLVCVCLDVNAPAIHEGYYARWEAFGHTVEQGGGWQAKLPLDGWGPLVGYVAIHGQARDTEFWKKIGTMAEIIEEFQVYGLSSPPVRRPTAAPVVTEEATALSAGA
jgi:UDP-GlcNAc:undecaprenyl-phosphate/decaprenyl-phosphate GlcNAc-1-phosphate transferase